MGIVLGRYGFEGPLATIETIEAASGIFALLRGCADDYELVELQESDDLRAAAAKVALPKASLADLPNEAVVFAVCYLPNHSSERRSTMVCEILREFDGDVTKRSLKDVDLPKFW